MPSINISNGNSFDLFFQVWLVRQQDYLDQLLFLTSTQTHPRREEELESLIGQVLAHYQHYYEAKSRAAHENVFLLFSPPWFSTFERSFLWIAGFRPALTFKILEKSVGSELTAHQVENVQRLKGETRVMENTLTDEMAKIQEIVVGPKWVQIVTTMGREAVDGGVDGEVDQAIESVRDALRDLVVNADCLRVATARKIVEILRPVQAAKFLAATAKLQLKIRGWGLQKDADRPSS